MCMTTHSRMLLKDIYMYLYRVSVYVMYSYLFTTTIIMTFGFHTYLQQCIMCGCTVLNITIDFSIFDPPHMHEGYGCPSVCGFVC